MSFDEWWEKQHQDRQEGEPWPMSKKLWAKMAFRAGMRQAAEICEKEMHGFIDNKTALSALGASCCVKSIKKELEK